ncbi:hypothetical protein A3H90_03365 [Candidatus Peribacteria bacterium RIFCSPLOWO2_02_FULL_55_36]|nr:MAG: hypothetical protein A2789_04145 [Candidatus Peribacteria bacterium RIFCSPHIGHO2_01_FULL_54_22]OGJ63267.1 MAG: hypothetical protein A3D12_02970 [Candidatus Peribacteria bacterium RIFCSPHIGHO2_02_FULL_55_24]OGJ63788.1 MAG: hypothetical protein A3E47_00090 [Candidatus Peribacteria bacterium RIFCSPHIGHO2_12_FULL_54_10]OGJ67613.1 MAG: hypothetical protein A2947_01535 [Candidatus Peribacteria bacterium RIFCSPLOWO2_01_FULL_54_110]OGJ70125.1 MAG: hypothetical protein A3H90_03365 [Candidatus Pe
MPTHRHRPIGVHLSFLIGFIVLIFGLWMLPVLLAGFPYVLPGFHEEAQVFMDTGMLPTGNGRLGTLIVWWLHTFLRWQNIIGWSAVSAAAFAAGLVPWWFSVRRLFDVQVAWLSTVVLGLLPMYWIEALRLSGYSFALFFLFLGFAFFLALRPRSRMAAIVAFGVCFGAVLGSRDAFIALLPWFVCAYVFAERRKLLRAGIDAAVFLAVAYVSFTLPLFFNALHTQGSLIERTAVLLPPFERTVPTPGHLYPDDYTYEFERTAFDERLRQEMKTASFLVRQQNAKMLYHYGVTKNDVVTRLKNSVWLFLNALPALFMEDTVGGPFLWLFIIPGIAVLAAERRKFLAFLMGLWLSMEFLLRFFFVFGRDHLMDVGWILALLAAVGIVVVAESVHARWRRSSLIVLTLGIVILMSAQLVTANRKQFARLYAHSEVPEMYAAEEVLAHLPKGAVVAHPRKHHLFTFSDCTHVSINRGTVDWLSEEGRLAAPFRHYGVTHIIGYDEEQTRKILAAVPRVKILPLVERGVPLTPLTKYLLHVVR